MDNAQHVNDLDRETIKKGLSDGSILLIDVREKNEFDAGHIPGSVSMPLSTFDPASIPLNTGKRIVFSCNSGRRTLQALHQTQRAGITLRDHYKGSFQDWLAAGEPINR
jgi:rhodanese-related sulfurtransferase